MKSLTFAKKLDLLSGPAENTNSTFCFYAWGYSSFLSWYFNQVSHLGKSNNNGSSMQAKMNNSVRINYLANQHLDWEWCKHSITCLFSSGL